MTPRNPTPRPAAAQTPGARRRPDSHVPAESGKPGLSLTSPPGTDRPGTPAQRVTPRSALGGGSQAPVTAVPDEPRVSGPAAVTGPSPAGGGKRSGAPSPAGSR